jgi:hypothetical protein
MRIPGVRYLGRLPRWGMCRPGRSSFGSNPSCPHRASSCNGPNGTTASYRSSREGSFPIERIPRMSPGASLWFSLSCPPRRRWNWRRLGRWWCRSPRCVPVVVDVRADERIEPSDAEAFAATARACGPVGWLFRRVGTPAPVFAANVRWLAGYRHPRCRRDGELARRLVEDSPNRRRCSPVPSGSGRGWSFCPCSITCCGAMS